METAILASVVPVAYLAGLLTSVRVIVWSVAGHTWRNQDGACWGSCKSYCEHRKPSQGWSSHAHAFSHLHAQDWAFAWLGALFWPALLPVYACWRPAKWFLLHPPKEKPQKLSLAEAVQRAEDELDAAREAQAAAQAQE